MESATAPLGDRSVLERSPLGRLPDRALKYGLTALALLILALIVYFFVRLVGEARPAFAKEGALGFIFSNNWDVNAESFGAFPLVVGTLITSALALVIGVPVAVAAAIYATELCPLRLRAPLTALVDLLAAVPSIVYGLWGIFVLAPKLQPAEQWVADRLSFIPFVGGTVTIPNYFIAGLVLAIMILPIVSAISREASLAAVLDQPHGDADADRDGDRGGQRDDLERTEQRALDPADARVLEERVARRIGREEVRAPRAEPLAEQVVDDQRQRDERDQRAGKDAHAGRPVRAPAPGADREASQLWRGCAVRAHTPTAVSAISSLRASGPLGANPRGREVRSTITRAKALTSSVSTNSTRPAANSALRCSPCASPNSLAIAAARL